MNTYIDKTSSINGKSLLVSSENSKIRIGKYLEQVAINQSISPHCTAEKLQTFVCLPKYLKILMY